MNRRWLKRTLTVLGILSMLGISFTDWQLWDDFLQPNGQRILGWIIPERVPKPVPQEMPARTTDDLLTPLDARSRRLAEKFDVYLREQAGNRFGPERRHFVRASQQAFQSSYGRGPWVLPKPMQRPKFRSMMLWATAGTILLISWAFQILDRHGSAEGPGPIAAVVLGLIIEWIVFNVSVWWFWLRA